MYLIQFRDKNRIIIHVGSGLQCFECNAYNDHICSKTGVQEGQIINCAKDETACSKSVGGKIFESILVPSNNDSLLFSEFDSALHQNHKVWFNTSLLFNIIHYLIL